MVYIHIYIYRERERHVYMHIYIYICIEREREILQAYSMLIISCLCFAWPGFRLIDLPLFVVSFHD